MGLRPFFSTIFLGPNREVWSPVSDPISERSVHKRVLLSGDDAGTDIAHSTQHARPDGEIQMEQKIGNANATRTSCGLIPSAIRARPRSRPRAEIGGPR